MFVNVARTVPSICLASWTWWENTRHKNTIVVGHTEVSNKTDPSLCKPFFLQHYICINVQKRMLSFSLITYHRMCCADRKKKMHKECTRKTQK